MGRLPRSSLDRLQSRRAPVPGRSNERSSRSPENSHHLTRHTPAAPGDRRSPKNMGTLNFQLEIQMVPYDYTSLARLKATRLPFLRRHRGLNVKGPNCSQLKTNDQSGCPFASCSSSQPCVWCRQMSTRRRR